MTIALLFGKNGMNIRSKMLSLRDDISIDPYSSISDLISGSKTRNKVYNRIIILSTVVLESGNIAKELQTLYNYWRSFCDSSEFIFVSREGVDDQLAEQFCNVMCSPLCTAVRIQRSSTVILNDIITKTPQDLAKQYGLKMDMSIEIETDTYEEPVVEQPKPAVQQPVTQAKPKKKGLLGKLFGKKGSPEAQTQEQPVQENEVQENFSETENFEQPTEYAENDGSYYDEQANMENVNYDENLVEQGYENAENNTEFAEEDNTYYGSQDEISEVNDNEPSLVDSFESGADFDEFTPISEPPAFENNEFDDEFDYGENNETGVVDNTVSDFDNGSFDEPAQVEEDDFNFDEPTQSNEEDDFNFDNEPAQAEDDDFDFNEPAQANEDDFDDFEDFNNEPVNNNENTQVNDDFDDFDEFDDFDDFEERPAVEEQPVTTENGTLSDNAGFDDFDFGEEPNNTGVVNEEPVSDSVDDFDDFEEPVNSVDENTNNDVDDFDFGGTSELDFSPAEESVEEPANMVEDDFSFDEIGTESSTQEIAVENTVPTQPEVIEQPEASVPSFDFGEIGTEDTVEEVPNEPLPQAVEEPVTQPEVTTQAQPAPTTKKKGFLSRFGKSEKVSSSSETVNQATNRGREASPLHQKFGRKTKPEPTPVQETVTTAQETYEEPIIQENINEMEEPTPVAVPKFNTPQRPVQNISTAQSVGSDEVADDDLFGDVDVAGLDSVYSEAEQASNVRVERVEVVREVIKEMPTSGGSKKVLKNLLSGNGHRVFLVTGDRGTGITTFAYELAQELAKHVGVLYYDGDTERHGLLNYIDIERYYQYDVAQQQGAKLAKSNKAFSNCVMRYDNNFDLISTGLGVTVTDEEYEAVQSVVADVSNDYNIIVAEIPFEKLHLCPELLQLSTVFVLAEQTKRGLINLGCCFDKSELSARHKRRITAMGTLVLTKGDKKVDVKKLKKHISDIIDFDGEDCNWIGMRTVVREKITEKYLQQIIE